MHRVLEGPEVTLTGHLHGGVIGCLDHSLDAAGTMLVAVLRKAHVWELANAAPTNDCQRLVLNRKTRGLLSSPLSLYVLSRQGLTMRLSVI